MLIPVDYVDTKNCPSAYRNDSNSPEQKCQGTSGNQVANVGNNISYGALGLVKSVTDVDVKSTSVWDGEHSSGMVAKENHRDRTHCGSKPKVSSTHTFRVSENVTSRGNVMTETMSSKYLVQCDIDTVLDPLVDSQFSKSFLFNSEIPQHIRQQCQYSRNFRFSQVQNGHDFGSIPLTDVEVYRGPKVVWDQQLDILEAHSIIRDSGMSFFF